MSGIPEEVMQKIAFIHKQMIESEKIKSSQEVFKYIDDYDSDVKEHYLNKLSQYYFQKNDLKNLKDVLLIGAKFEMKFSDVQEAFLHIYSKEENVIEYMEEEVIFIKDSKIGDELQSMYDYYMKNEHLKEFLDEVVGIIKENRYVCAHCFKYNKSIYAKFFLDEELLDNLKRDMPYILE